MRDNNSLHTEKMAIIRSWGEQKLLQWLDKRHIEKYTLLNFSQKLLQEKKNPTTLVSICLILADKVISLCNWSVNPALGLLYFVDFFPHTITSCKRPALSCTKGGCLQENHRNSVNACQQILPG